MTRPLAVHVPACCPRLGDTVLLSTSPLSTEQSDEHLTRTEISRRVRLIVADEFQIPVEKIAAETNFARDLRR